MQIPTSGMHREAILEQLTAYQKDDVDWSSGRVFGYVFDPGSEILAFAREVYNRFLTESALDFTVYPSLLRLENDLVDMMLLRPLFDGVCQIQGHFLFRFQIRDPVN
ncbi:MAG: hypothetical protein ACQET7_12390 [Thermodesulfobacteriota bacterium]